jgi:signal transduction histidine kinase/ligand-binding sensor protein
MSRTISSKNITLLDLFTKEELQKKQDLFSEAMGVASIITLTDGTPVTKASNFCHLCMGIIRKTKKGLVNCMKSDSVIGRFKLNGPSIKPCLSGGLWDAGVSINFGEKHVGNWLIGQVKNGALDHSKILAYADEIGADRLEFEKALADVPEMPLERFTKVAEMLFVFVNELTEKAYSNLLLKQEIKKREKISNDLKKNEIELLKNDRKLKLQNNDYLALNEELRQTNLELINTLEKLRQSQLALKKQNLEYVAINDVLNRANDEYLILNEELNQKNEEYFSLNEEIRLTNLQLQSTLSRLDESNKRNESLLSAIPDIMFLFSKEDVFLDCHIPDGDMLIMPKEAFMNKRVQDILPPEIVSAHEMARKKLFETGQPQVYQYAANTAKGLKYFESSMVMHDENKILAIVRDISQVKKAMELEQEILVTRKSAEFKQKFLANMSHEIRTPLTGMMGLADILANTELNEKQKLYVEHLRQSGENLRHIINLILDYSKIESGQITIKPIAFASDSMFDSATNLFSSVCQKPIQLLKDLSPDIPDYIITDQHRLNQILNNLVSNAVKFTEEGSISLSASVFKEFSNPANSSEMIIKVEVSDTGIGIQPDLQKYLFKPFSQIETNEMRSIEGTGLGLSICRELSALLGGEIGIESKPGKGSTFWFTFKTTKADVSQIIIKPKNNHLPGPNKSKLNILLVEDKKVNQMVVTLILKDLGHKVMTANNGQEAIDHFNPDHFDLILMDIQMPVMDGITATAFLKQKYSQLPPIVGLSANAFEGDREKYMAMGMDDYLTKPVKGEDFNELIERLEIR